MRRSTGIRRERTRARRALLAAVLAAALAAAPAHPAEPPPLPEPALKAAFLFHFAKYVAWPDGDGAPDSPFPICIVGGDAVRDALAALAVGKTLHDRPVEVRTVTDVAGAEGCRVAYVAPSEADDRIALLAALTRHHALTVSDAPDLATNGSVIGFHVAERKLRFVIDAGAAGQAQLRISSQLLKLATRVLNDPGSLAPGARILAGHALSRRGCRG